MTMILILQIFIEGAKKFAQCANATECALLWDTAKKWVTEKSKYNGTLKTNTKNLLETKANPRRSKANKITFKVNALLMVKQIL